MSSQKPRKTKPLPKDRPVTRADLMVLARAVDQSIADLRAELDARLPNSDFTAPNFPDPTTMNGVFDDGTVIGPDGKVIPE